MYSVNDIRFFTVCVSTFRNPRIEAYLQLPVAYRSLSRLSSAPDAKAFSLCSCLLELLLMCYFLSNTVFTRSLYQELLSYLKTVIVFRLSLLLAILHNYLCGLIVIFFTLNLKLYLERPFLISSDFKICLFPC